MDNLMELKLFKFQSSIILLSLNNLKNLGIRRIKSSEFAIKKNSKLQIPMKFFFL